MEYLNSEEEELSLPFFSYFDKMWFGMEWHDMPHIFIDVYFGSFDMQLLVSPQFWGYALQRRDRWGMKIVALGAKLSEKSETSLLKVFWTLETVWFIYCIWMVRQRELWCWYSCINERVSIYIESREENGSQSSSSSFPCYVIVSIFIVLMHLHTYI